MMTSACWRRGFPLPSGGRAPHGWGSSGSHCRCVTVRACVCSRVSGVVCVCLRARVCACVFARVRMCAGVCLCVPVFL